MNSGVIWGAIASIGALAFAQGIAPLIASTLTDPIVGLIAYFVMKGDKRYQSGVVYACVREKKDRRTVVIERCVVHDIKWSGIELRPIEQVAVDKTNRTGIVGELGTARHIPLSDFKQYAPEIETWSVMT